MFTSTQPMNKKQCNQETFAAFTACHRANALHVCYEDEELSFDTGSDDGKKCGTASPLHRNVRGKSWLRSSETNRWCVP